MYHPLHTTTISFKYYTRCLVLTNSRKYLWNCTLFERSFQIKPTLFREIHLVMFTNLIEISNWLLSFLKLKSISTYILYTPLDAFCNSLQKVLTYLVRKVINLKDILTLILWNLSHEKQGKITQYFYVYVFLDFYTLNLTKLVLLS